MKKKPSLKVEFTDRRDHPIPIIAWLIRMIEGTEFSHVAMRIRVGDGREFVYHSTFTGVNFLNTKLYDKKYYAVESHEFEITKEEQKKLITYFLDIAGNSYPVTEIVGVAIVRLVDRLFGLKINNPLGSNKMFCSEVALKVLKLLGYQLPISESKINALREIEQILRDKKHLHKA